MKCVQRGIMWCALCALLVAPSLAASFSGPAITHAPLRCRQAAGRSAAQEEPRRSRRSRRSHHSHHSHRPCAVRCAATDDDRDGSPLWRPDDPEEVLFRRPSDEL